jgi:hypothetical protein
MEERPLHAEGWPDSRDIIERNQILAERKQARYEKNLAQARSKLKRSLWEPRFVGIQAGVSVSVGLVGAMMFSEFLLRNHDYKHLIVANGLFLITGGGIATSILDRDLPEAVKQANNAHDNFEYLLNHPPEA